jgi:ABC-type antimicrobial peptide transport system permease subunit
MTLSLIWKGYTVYLTRKINFDFICNPENTQSLWSVLRNMRWKAWGNN